MDNAKEYTNKIILKIIFTRKMIYKNFSLHCIIHKIMVSLKDSIYQYHHMQNLFYILVET